MTISLVTILVIALYCTVAGLVAQLRWRIKNAPWDDCAFLGALWPLYLFLLACIGVFKWPWKFGEYAADRLPRNLRQLKGLLNRE